MIIKPYRTLHLSVDRAQQFLAENVSEHAADEHGHEQQEHNYEVLERKRAVVKASAPLYLRTEVDKLESRESRENLTES